MTQRKPANVNFESWIEAQIRQARERGEFDNLQGFGQPLRDLDGNHDEMWWIRKWLERENVGFTPPAIALRKAAEDLLASVDGFATERALRTSLDELNTRIRQFNRSPVLEGPPSNLMPLDVEPIVERWRAARPVASDQPAAPEPVTVPKRRWFRRPRQ
ncbi:MAG TPA: DUF1992 domain-containing protein [Acidimicrobiales bacterium]|nr:DUF1992 domain-containing protein [Acidimicrobiales bacterium]